MNTATRPFSYVFAPALLVLMAVLAAGNWYFRPGHAGASVLALLLAGGMTLALVLIPRRLEEEGARRRMADEIRRGIAYAGVIVVLSLGVKLAAALGTAADVELSWRAIMAILGAFFVFTGNTIPKMLRPLTADPEDAARVQAFQRFTGWTWVLTGIAFAIGWLWLPASLAEWLTFILLPGAILLVTAQFLRMRRGRAGAATGHD